MNKHKRAIRLSRIAVAIKQVKRKSNYRSGRSREHGLRRRLIREDWFVMRSYKSAGGMPGAKVKPIDLFAVKKGKTDCMIQVSRWKRHISEAEITELTRLAKEYGTDAILAYTENGKWVFENILCQACINNLAFHLPHRPCSKLDDA